MTNSNVSIRPHRPSDALPIFEAVQESLAEVSVWMSDLNADLTQEAIRVYIESQPQLQKDRKAYNFAITDSSEEQILGGCGLTYIQWHHRFANLYYWVRSSQTRRGIASAAVLLLARFGFENLGLQRIEMIMAVSNLSSIRVAEKVGAAREGRLRNRITANGTVHDAFLYSLIPSDLE